MASNNKFSKLPAESKYRADKFCIFVYVLVALIFLSQFVIMFIFDIFDIL